MVNLTINNMNIEVEKGTTILEAAKKIGVNVPNLCNMYFTDERIKNCKGSCRVCLVEDVKKGKLITSCTVEAKDGMEIKTHTKRAIEARKTIVELLLSEHPMDCLNCTRNLSCELQKLASDFGITSLTYTGEKIEFEKDLSSPSIVRDMNKCVLCRRCVTACNEVQDTNILTAINRGINTKISTFNDMPLKDTNCVFCGQCVAVCPTAALHVVDDYHRVFDFINDQSKYVIVQIAPAVRVSLEKEFEVDSGSNLIKKISSALRKIGFDGVYDTNFGADMTIMEEVSEFMDRLNKNEDLPLLTSCCPAWVKFVEQDFKENINNLSTTKSPQQIFGALSKTYLAEKLSVDPKDLIVVSVMPCVAKKFECARKEMVTDGIRDVDAVITTRELLKMFKEFGFDLSTMEDGEMDSLFGEASGAGAIFGASGGVTEAALRTLYELTTNKKLENLDFKEVRGLKGIKETSITINGRKINAAVVSSLKKARQVMEDVKNGKSKYDFIEVMACPGGCINGGGQPFMKWDMKKLNKRVYDIYRYDTECLIRKSHENPIVKEVYDKFLIEPNSEKAHKLLHVNLKSKEKN